MAGSQSQQDAAPPSPPEISLDASFQICSDYSRLHELEKIVEVKGIDWLDALHRDARKHPWTHVHYAAAHSPRTFEWLHIVGARMNSLTFSLFDGVATGSTALHVAVAKGQPDSVKYMLSHAVRSFVNYPNTSSQIARDLIATLPPEQQQQLQDYFAEWEKQYPEAADKEAEEPHGEAAEEAEESGGEAEEEAEEANAEGETTDEYADASGKEMTEAEPEPSSTQQQQQKQKRSVDQEQTSANSNRAKRPRHQATVGGQLDDERRQTRSAAQAAFVGIQQLNADAEGKKLDQHLKHSFLPIDGNVPTVGTRVSTNSDPNN